MIVLKLQQVVELEIIFQNKSKVDPKMAEFEGTGINIVHMRGRYNMIKAQKPSGGTVNPDDCARLSKCKSVS